MTNDVLFPMILWAEWDQPGDFSALLASAEITHSAELGWKVQGLAHTPGALLFLHLASPHGEAGFLPSMVVSEYRGFQDFCEN